MTRSGAFRALAGAVLLFLAAGLQAAAPEDEKIIVPGRSGGGSAAAPTMAGSASSASLLVGLAMAAVGGWLLWRSRRQPAGVDGKRSLAIEETRPLGNRQYLVVASYEGRRFLLGVCPGRIEMLTALESPVERREGK